MVGTEKIRVVDGAGLAAIAMTKADMIVVVDRDSVILNGTCPMPVDPINGQLFELSLREEITNLTMDTGGKDIYGSATKLFSGTSIAWIFDTESDAWFPRNNPIGNPATLQTAVAGKQPLLESGVNIKTVNGSSLLGAGNVAIAGVAAWGSVTGTLSDQTDLQTALNGKLATNGNGGSLTGLTATQVGLGNVTNESKATMFTSPAFTGNIPTGLGMPVFSRVTGSNATTTGQALVDITGLTSSLVANAVYKFEANISASTSNVTTGIQYGVQFSAAGATIEAQIIGASSTTATKAERITTLNTATTAFLATSNQHGAIRITGVIATGANAGTLSMRHLKATSGTATAFINSILETTRIA